MGESLDDLRHQLKVMHSR